MKFNIFSKVFMLTQMSITKNLSFSVTRRLCMGARKLEKFDQENLKDNPSELSETQVEKPTRCQVEENMEMNLNLISDQNLTEKDREKIKMMKAEYELWKYADGLMPEQVDDNHWKILLNSKTPKERINYLTYLQKKVLRKENKLATKETRQIAIVERKQQEFLSRNSENCHLIYSLGHNSIFKRMHRTSFSRLQKLRAMNALLFAPHIAYDTSFINQLSMAEQSATIKQIIQSITINMSHREPSALIFTNVNRNEAWFSKLQMLRCPYSIDDEVILVTEKSYLDLYPRDRLIYLSPDAPDVLTEFDSEKVYIIGAIVDKHLRPGLSLRKIRNENIATYKLPLDYCVKWETGTKYLQLQHVLKMLLDLNLTNDLHESISSNIPSYKLTPAQPTERKITKRKMYIERNRYLESLVKAIVKNP